jgi:hypothetical protein
MRKRILAGILYQLEFLLSGRVLVLRTQQTVSNIVEHCPTEQHWLLLHKTNLGAQVPEIQVAYVATMVLFPEPLAPTRAVVFLAGIESDSPLST